MQLFYVHFRENTKGVSRKIKAVMSQMFPKEKKLSPHRHPRAFFSIFYKEKQTNLYEFLINLKSVLKTIQTGFSIFYSCKVMDVP